MPDHVLVKHVPKYADQEITLRGWVYNIRKSGKIWFLIFRDGTNWIQCVVLKNEVSENVFEMKNTLTQESSIEIRGRVQKAPRQEFGYEILVKDIKIYQIAEEYPIALKEHGIEFLLDNRHLWLRSRKPNAVLKIRAEVEKACRNFFDERDFVLVDSPMFTPNAAEGTTTLFETDYFGRKAYLTQSGQLYSEAAIMAFNKTYCFGPCFRAEKSKTRRHLTEFWMIEPEMAFYDIHDNMDLAEEFVSYLVQRVVKNCPDELNILERDLSKLEKITPPFPRITYDEAVAILNKKGLDFEWGNDFGAPHETAISEDFDKPVMIWKWPAETKAFYMKRDPENERYVLGVDMIAPEGFGEIIGGSQREEDINKLLARIKKENLPEEIFNWFIDVRRYGSVPHSGFGLGLERTVQWICGLHHIRECIPWPRTMVRLNP
ncbi:MAG: asparagine--tRNA ligase [Candidatus Neomarinimicrobiota bacterium]|nr:asparagine--tRNA ligase [Candidatus Neomarinimicrobiota bacterium]RKY48116.1 MAG: asparagine--tRNA ligase [Candidatus Neomarinimicrobiota bacterium]